MDITGFDLIKYNRDRLPRYQVETAIISTPRGRMVRKRALYPEGRDHVLGMLGGARLLKERLHGANVPAGSMDGDDVVFEFIEGDFIEDVILRRASQYDKEGILDAMDKFRHYLGSMGSAPAGSAMRGVPADLLSHVPALDEMMPLANLDLTFDNVVIDHNGRYWMTDVEWVFDSPIPRSFIIYRGLYVLFLRHGARLEQFITFPECLSHAGIPQALWEPYRQACEGFIDMVLGKDRGHMVPPAYRRGTHQLASLSYLQDREEKLYAARLELEATKRALDEMLEGARRREALLQEQERRLGAQSDQLETLKRDIAERDGDLEGLRVELESERLRLKAVHAQLELERAHAFKLIDELESIHRACDEQRAEISAQEERIAQAIREIEGEKAFSRQLQEELRIAEQDLGIARTALADRESELLEALKERDENFVRLQDMTERFMGKQAELMTMSDWARSMQLRLEFLESIPAIRFTERMARSYKQAVDKLKSEGPGAMLKSVLLKVAPQQLQRMLHRQEPSNMGDLKADAEGKDVLVVFPVIPWEFRWQRPQQLVSRFAANGYTVLFVNMTITPRGSRYINDLEALNEVRLGKLKEHIFELHLSSFNKINVYQDRIKGADLNNVAHGLLSVLRDLEPRSVTYLVQFPGWGQLANLARARVPGTLVFDCMDDHAGFSNNATEVVKRETKLMEKADLVVASSAKLQEKALTFNDNTILVRNGTDFEMFHDLRPNGKLDGMRRPIIGYHGAISEWFDPEVVFRCAQKHPEWNFVLIGSTLGCQVNGLKKLPNVHLLGEMPYRELPGYLHYFDVCIIPFKVCELTLATNPVKFYEYISSGKPTVSVRLPEMEQYADICYLYRTDEEFERGIIAALEERDDELKERRIQVAKDSSWDHRFQEVREKLEEMKGGEEPRLRLLRRRSDDEKDSSER